MQDYFKCSSGLIEEAYEALGGRKWYSSS